MIITRIIAIGLAISSISLTALHAQSLRIGSTPAEFPPASYKGKQYVDSKGCVYVRAGIDGNVTWVPRVTRDRKLVCGYKPTGGTSKAAAAAPKATAKPEQITIAPAKKSGCDKTRRSSENRTQNNHHCAHAAQGCNSARSYNCADQAAASGTVAGSSAKHVQVRYPANATDSTDKTYGQMSRCVILVEPVHQRWWPVPRPVRSAKRAASDPTG